jgi:pimeloyl-ACP methyl ester carboxylesterase
MIETTRFDLHSGIGLHCRISGPAGAPVLLFLHGFPEAAFIWDGLLERFGSRYRCVAPNLRGFGPSSAPTDPALYRTKHLIGDIDGLIECIGTRPVEALIAHDWGGALAWAIAAQQPQWIRRLIIINSPHPAIFLRELQHNPAQQAASAYMNFLCRPDAEQLLAENDFARLWPFFTCMGACDTARVGGNWLTEELRERYRAVWRAGLTGGCNYYRASPLRPPTAQDSSVMDLVLAPERFVSRRPTLVIWGEDDIALPPALIDGLEAYVPDLQLTRVPGATHWIVHERPDLIGEQIRQHLERALAP